MLNLVSLHHSHDPPDVDVFLKRLGRLLFLKSWGSLGTLPKIVKMTWIHYSFYMYQGLFSILILVLMGSGCMQLPVERTEPQTVVASTRPIAVPTNIETLANETTEPTSLISPPMARAWERVTKKPFGLRVSPKNSPVSPERFSGFHTGTDFETFPEEAETDVPVMAICTGPLLRVATADGYGGYAVQSCTIQEEAVTVVYGHLRRTSVTAAGEVISAGQSFAVLGKGFSGETDGERKHLHLGIVRGTTVNIHGYVSSAETLKQWVDASKLTK
jgi:hypothetical protein